MPCPRRLNKRLSSGVVHLHLALLNVVAIRDVNWYNSNDKCQLNGLAHLIRQEEGSMKSTAAFALTLVLAVMGSLMVPTGSASAKVYQIEGNDAAAGLTLRSQGMVGCEFDYGMRSFGMEPVEIRGEMYQTITLPEVFLPNNAGAPNLPNLSRFVAIPQGATATVEIVSMETRVYRNVEIAPAPEIPLETDDGPLRYAHDLSIYERNAFYPEAPVQISAPRKLRGVDFVAVGLTPFQYNPVTKELHVYMNLEIRIDFIGGHGQFGEDRLRNRYWEPLLREHLANYATLAPMSFDRSDETRYGYEYVIITPDDPDFIAWGDSLKAWRTLQGITTEVFTTSEIGATATQIEDWLNTAYATWEGPPAAFLSLGDYPDSGDRDTGVTSPIWNSYCVSDNIYADVDDDDMPDMVHARITARDAAELETMIGKMFSYERNPYSDPDFYDHPIIAGGWQTERWFILCCEVIYGHQANVLGKDPVREYAIYSGNPGSVWSTNSNTNLVVDYFGPSGLGYIPATPMHLTDWGGDAERINADINAGAYMLMHRDHGWYDGWGEPDYGNDDLAGLTNDKYPFVFSVNCLTGKYNWEDECFAEAFHRMGHGALGLLAASETSYSFVNDTFVWGLCDGLWPDFMPDSNADSLGACFMRPAFGMASGKYFLEGSSWPSNPNNKEVTYHLFHHHGGAFLMMYSEVPQEIAIEHYATLPLNSDAFSVTAPEGSVIALSVDGELIGVADGTGAPQLMEIIPQAAPGTLRITVTLPNHYRYDESIPIGGTAYLVKADGTGDYPTIQAAIDAATTGIIIELEDGVYTGTGNSDLDYAGKAITVRSLSGDPTLCVIDCVGPVHRGFYFHLGESPASVVENITIRNGNVTGFGDGGGIYCDDISSPTIRGCIFESNQADLGGGLWIGAFCSPVITDCRFLNNTAAVGYGGGVAGHPPVLTNCHFESNHADFAGGGAGLDYHPSGNTVSSCTFVENSAQYGAGIALLSMADVSSIENCTLVGNDGDFGSGIYYHNSTASNEIANTIVALNHTGEAIGCVGIAPTLACSDLYGNAGGDWVGPISGQYGLSGNISEDPLFCDAAGGDYTIKSVSRCGPDYNPDCGLIGAHPVGCEPATFVVAADGSGDYPTIQAAVDAAEFGGIIELLDGTYLGTGNHDVNIGGKTLTIRSASGDPTACAMYCDGSVPTPHRAFIMESGETSEVLIENLMISHGYAGGADPNGGAIYCANGATPTISGCMLSGNMAEGSGGAFYGEASQATFIDCLFDANTAVVSGGGVYAGSASYLTLTGSTFYLNGSPSGGGIYCDSGAALAVNTTIVSFSTVGEAVGVDPGAMDATLMCCDLYGNAGGDWVGWVAPQLGINGNIGEDPFFCDPGFAEWTLYPDSPCAPENSGGCGLIGAYGVGCTRPFQVNAEGTGDYPTIQAALDAAVSGHTIELADGIYRGTGNRDLDFFGKALTLRSASGDANACVIDAEGSSSAMHTGIRFHSGEGADAVVRGITFSNAYHALGAGIFCQAASPTIINCVIRDCEASSMGGGLYCYQAMPTLTGCTFVGNTSTSGGAMFLNGGSDVPMENCIIAFHNGTGQTVFGISSTPTLTCCDVYGNEGGDYIGCLEGQLGINGNISEDPMFCEPTADNYTIDEDSFCAPEHSGGCELIGALPVDCGLSDAEDFTDLPRHLALSCAVPSSAQGLTQITYAIPGDGIAPVQLNIYDPSGRRVRTLIHAEHSAGVYRVNWNGMAENGSRVGSGVYFARLTWNSEERTRTLVLVK